MVHWQEAVGKDNLDKFIAIQKGVLISAQKSIGEDEALSKAIKGGMSEDDIQMWRNKRQMLRRCGYEQDGPIFRFHGWYRARMNHSGQLEWYIDPSQSNPTPFIEYISMQKWLDWLKGHDEPENKTYNAQGMVNRVVREIGKPKPRADIDADFPEEEAL
jgi:hypothetical protein